MRNVKPKPQLRRQPGGKPSSHQELYALTHNAEMSTSEESDQELDVEGEK